MRRWLHAHTFVHGPIAGVERRLLREHTVLLARATDSAPPDGTEDGWLMLHLTSSAWTLEITKQVRVRVGVSERPDHRVVLPVSWDAEPARPIFPHFDGAFELEPLSSRSSALTLSGAYTPPLGMFGAVADWAGLHRIARHTARRLVRRLGEELSTAVASDDDRPAVGVGSAAQLRVRDVMTPDPVVLSAEGSLRDAARLLYSAGISGAPVVDDGGQLIGVLSERDLLTKEAPPAYGTRARRRHEAATVIEACSRPARTVHPDTRLRETARLMLIHGVSRLVVVADGAIRGIVTRHDVLRALFRADRVVEAAVSALLRDRDEPDVTAFVTNGDVQLSGVARRRSSAHLLPEEVSAIDGVMSVDTRLRWRDDDLVTGRNVGAVTRR